MCSHAWPVSTLTYIESQLAHDKSGRRKSSAMQPMVDDLSASDFELLGVYFESRKPQAYPVADPELAQVGRYVFLRGNPYSGVAACAGCHGPKGAGTETPAAAGRPACTVHREPA